MNVTASQEGLPVTRTSWLGKRMFPSSTELDQLEVMDILDKGDPHASSVVVHRAGSGLR